MSQKHTRRTVLSLIIVLASLGIESRAVDLSKWNPLRYWGRKNRVDSLIITGNFSRSRLLAELAQTKTKQPIILISPESQGQNQMYFMPSRPEAMAFESARYRDFISFLQPRRVVILGDARFVPQTFVEEARSLCPTVIINGADWRKNAKALGDVLRHRSLGKRYNAYLDTLEAAAGGAAVPAGSTAVPGAVPEPGTAPQVFPEL